MLLSFCPWYRCKQCGGNCRVSGRTLNGNHRSRRIKLAAAEATQAGYGGVSLVSRACGLSRVTIMKGIEGIGCACFGPGTCPACGRRTAFAGAARSSIARVVGVPGRAADAWRSGVAAALDLQEHPDVGGRTGRTTTRISHEKVAQLLRQMDYSLQSNRKTEEGGEHPDRDAQFRHINRQVQLACCGKASRSFRWDTKKKELIGNFENKGRQWRRQGDVEKVQDHDFLRSGGAPGLSLRGFTIWPGTRVL